MEARDAAGGDSCGSSAGAPGARARPPRAALLLARPGPDTSVSPPAGGEVPDGALAGVGGHRRGPGEVLRRLQGRGRRAVARRLAHVAARGPEEGLPAAPEPAEDQALQARRRERLLAINAALAEQCEYDSVQPAVNDSGNNDRVVIMPGRYTEPESRSAPGERPDLQPEPAPGGRQRRPDAELRVPGHLPQRPEPDLRPGPRGRRRAAGAAARRTARASRRRSSARACAATSRSRAPAPSPRT